MILLMVMLLLGLFTLIGVAYVMATLHARAGALAAARLERTGDHPSTLLQQAVRQVIRGPRNPYSAILSHDVLGDLYGGDGQSFDIPAVAAGGNQPGVMGAGSLMIIQIPDLNAYPQLNPSVGFYAGRVATMTTGQARNKSTRIVAYEVNLSAAPPTATFFLQPFPGMQAANPAAWLPAGAPQPFDTMLINGRPYNGTGTGIDPRSFAASGLLNHPDAGPDEAWGAAGVDDDGANGTDDIGEAGFGDDGGVIALLPNPNRPGYRSYLTAIGAQADEDYDAVDYQNMHLAGRFWNTATAQWEVRFPSYHRPDLLAYHGVAAGGGGWNAIPVPLRRKIMLRPLPDDHVYQDVNNNGQHDSGEPDFTGKPIDPIVGVWDVDNDGDGLPDSVWLDLGLPTQTAPDGRKYKPLVAVLCLDQDSKLNLNAHGNTGQFVLTGPNPPDWNYVSLNTNGNSPYAGANTQPTLPMGAGYSPADINLGAIWGFLPVNSGGLNELRFLLEGRLNGAGTVAVPGRYGEQHLLFGGLLPRPGLTSSSGLPGGFGGAPLYSGDDNLPISTMVQGPGGGVFQFRGNYYADGFFPGMPLGHGATPSMLAGRGNVALDLRGQPIWWHAGYQGPQTAAAGISDAIDDPGEMDLSGEARIKVINPGPDGVPGTADDVAGQTASVDEPFTATDLERLLQYNTIDARSQSPRLELLAPSLASDPFRRGLVTHGSYDLSVPSVVVPRELRDVIGGIADDLFSNAHLTLIMRNRFLQAGYPPLAQHELNMQLQDYLPSDLLAGLRMDLNQPFGNGVDDNGNGAVDEPMEGQGVQPLWVTSIKGPREFDGNNNGQTSDDSAPNIAFNMRQRFARTLYVLAMTFKDQNYVLPSVEYPSPPPPALPNPDAVRLTNLRLAQWAANVVDFRDRDSAMTAFEVDLQPFTNNDADPNGTTWDVDGDIGTNEGAYRTIVWGCEYPDAVISENISFHDKRTEDLATPNGLTTGMGETDGTNDFDQRRIPQGSSFVEIYCTRNPNNPGFSELYRLVGGEYMLDLGRMDAAGSRPIWRLAVGDTTTDVDNNVIQRLIDNPDTTTLEPDAFSVAPAPGPNVTLERLVWFSTTPPNTGDPLEDNRVYYNHAAGANADVLLRAGHYALVGPHRNPESGTDNISKIGWAAVAPAPQEIRLGDVAHPTGAGGRTPVEVTNNNGPSTYPTANIQAAVGIPVAGDVVGWTVGGGAIGFSISEPLYSSANYYPLPTDPALTTDPHDGTQTQDLYNPPLDEPLDNSALRPLGADSYLETATRANYKTVFLQRLADPSLPYDPTYNPYRTIDWMPMDLTVFNGEYAGSNPDPEDPTPDSAPIVAFGTRQRGLPRTPPAIANNDFNLWKQPTWNVGPAGPGNNDLPNTNPEPLQPAPFAHNLDHTLGYINLPFHDLVAANAWHNGATLVGAYAPFAAMYTGDPLRPFPWLTWLDRPFASNLELLQVPATSSARLLHEFDMRRANFVDHYADRVPAPPTYSGGPPFGHLLNFFQGYDPNAATPLPAGNHYNLLEYVHVPSRYSGTQDSLDPVIFEGPGAGPHPFHPPFNTVSTYREPGKLNANTLFDEGSTWQGVMNQMQNAQYFDSLSMSNVPVDNEWFGLGMWLRVLGSRRGYGGLAPNPLLPHPLGTSPTVFANPFRSYGAQGLVPVVELRHQNVDTGAPQRLTIDETLLRPDRADPSPIDRPLFAANNQAGAPPSDALDYGNTDRNPYFRYQAMQRLGNLMTTRSNVFAIWVTVGYFEVERVPVNSITHPDGWRLVREMGSDSGEIERQRGFYIYDRSIPVGYSPGENLNIDRGFLLQKVVE